MTTEYLKRANPPTETIDPATSETVQRMLAQIKREGRESAKKRSQTQEHINEEAGAPG